MSPLEIWPAVVWCLDEPSKQVAQRWWEGTPTDVKVFIRLCSTPEVVRRTLEEFNREGFDEELAAVGVARRRQGTRVHVVTLASAAPDFGSCFNEWADVEGLLESFREKSLVRELRHIPILLVHATDSTREWLTGSCEGRRLVPWLISCRRSDLVMLDEESLLSLLRDLLTVLLLSERSGDDRLNRFFGEIAMALGPPRVRLVGFPAISMEGPWKGRVAHATAAAAFEKLLGDPQTTRADLEALRAIVRRFLDSEMSLNSALDRIFGSHGILGLPVGALLDGELARELETLAQQVEAESRSEEVMRDSRTGPIAQESAEPGTHRPSARRGMRSRVLDWLRGWFSAPGPPDSNAAADADRRRAEQRLRQAEVDSLASALEVASRLFRGFRAARGSSTPARGVPRDLEDQLEQQLTTIIHEELRSIGANGTATAKSAKDLWESFLEHVRGELAGRFFEAISAWGIDDRQVEEIADALANGHFLRFSAARHGGLPITPEIAVSSSDAPEQIRAGEESFICKRLRVWSGAGPVLIAVSQPVPAEQIRI